MLRRIVAKADSYEWERASKDEGELGQKGHGDVLVSEEDVDQFRPEVVPLFAPDLNALARQAKFEHLSRVGPLDALSAHTEGPRGRALVRARDDDDLDRVRFREGRGEERA